MKKFKEKQKERDKLFWMLLIASVFIIYFCKNKKEEEMELLSIKKQSISKDTIISYNFFFDKECNDEHIKKRENLYHDSIFKYIKRFKEIDSYTWGHCFGHFKCQGKGYLIYQNHGYEYEINAGGWIKLISKNNKIKLLGSMDKKDTVNFISVYYCDEDWDNIN